MPQAVLIQIDGWDPVAAATVTLRMASQDDPALCMVNDQVWWPVLGKLPVLSYDFFDGAFGGGIVAPASSFTCSVEPWATFGRFILADARIQIWRGELGAAWGGFTLLFDGRVSAQPDVQGGIASVEFAVDDRWLDTPLLPTYAGTGGAEGAAAMKGVVKPLALGTPRYVPGRLVDAVNTVFQVSGCGAIQSVEFALDRLVRLPAPTADYGSYAALIGATIAPGEVATCLALGLVRHGAPPAGKVSYLVRGDKAGPDGWARLPGQLIRRIALISGGSGKIADASLNALDTARPYNVSLFVDQQMTARDLIQSIAASVNAVAGVSWLGKLFVQPIGYGTASITLAADGSALPPVASVRQIAQGAPFWKLAMLAERTWAVHDAGTDVALADPTPPSITSTTQPTTGVPGQIWFNPTTGQARTWDPILGFGGPALVDLTTEATPRVEGPPGLTFSADFTGVIGDGQLPATANLNRLRGSTDVSTSTTWSIVSQGGITGGTVTVSNGVVTIPAGVAVPASTSITVRSVRDGVTIDTILAVTKTTAAPPSTGGGGGTTVSDSTFGSVSGTSFVAISDLMTVKTGSGGQIALTAASIETIAPAASPTGTFTIELQWRWRTIGGSWNTLTARTNSADAVVETESGAFFAYRGSVTSNETVTGLSASTDHEVQLTARRTSATPTKTISFAGSAVAVGS